MGSLLKSFGALFILAPFAAMFSEPFFEAVFDGLGWDTESAAPPIANAVLALSNMISTPWVANTTCLLAAFGAGVWVHSLALSYDKKPPKHLEVAAKGMHLANRIGQGLSGFRKDPRHLDQLLMASWAQMRLMQKIGLSVFVAPENYDSARLLDLSAQFFRAFYAGSIHLDTSEAVETSRILAEKYQNALK